VIVGCRGRETEVEVEEGGKIELIDSRLVSFRLWLASTGYPPPSELAEEELGVEEQD